MIKKNKATKKLNNDLYLLAISPIVFISGIFTYISFFVNDILWIDGHTWMNVHAISSLIIYYFAIRHITDHWSWYKKNWQKFRYSFGYLWLFSILFSLTGLTGFVILFFSGENSLEWLILTHVIFGTLTLYFVIQHIIKYFSAIKKWINHKKSSFLK